MDKLLLAVGIVLMAYNLFDVLRLKRRAPGGIVGSRLTQLTIFIALFAAAYLAVGALTLTRSADVLLLLLTAILAGGGLFVLLVLKLVEAILSVLET